MGFDPISTGIQVGGGLISGLFGGGPPQVPPEQARLYHFLMMRAKELLRYSKGIPMSDPQEQAALAQAKGLAAGNFQGQRERLYSGLSNSLDPNGGGGSVSDMVQRFNSNQAGQMSSMDFQAVMQSLQNRHNAIGESAQIAGGAGGAAHSYYQPDGNLGSMFGQFAQGLGYQMGMSKNNAASAAPNGVASRPAYEMFNPRPNGQAGGYGDFNAGAPPIYG